MTDRVALIMGALLAAVGVTLGAFGAHALKASLSPEALGWWQTGVQYQMWNAIGLVALAALRLRLRTAGLLIASGTVVFAGSLYLMALTDMRWLGAVTPVGGLLMIAGWLLVLIRAIRHT
jgi:uncharacterized membrane protein YgdD (TMEM256/DUF423 family)